jgi:hypothetical protein
MVCRWCRGHRRRRGRHLPGKSIRGQPQGGVLSGTCGQYTIAGRWGQGRSPRACERSASSTGGGRGPGHVQSRCNAPPRCCQSSPVMGPLGFAQRGPLPEMTLMKLLTENRQTIGTCQGHGVDPMGTFFPGFCVPCALKLLPVMTIIWARWVRRSKPAEANKGLPRRSGHSSGARLLVSKMLPRS